MRMDLSLRLHSDDSYESGSESDNSMRSSVKKVHFCGENTTDSNGRRESCSNCERLNGSDGSSNSEHSRTDDLVNNSRGVTNDNAQLNNSRRKNETSNGSSSKKINRGGIPNGSDLFRQVLKEIQTEETRESEEEVCTPRSECDTPSGRPLKSILKKRASKTRAA